MKNGKINLNKTKLIARVMLVILLFSSALNLAGCGNNYTYYRHQEVDGHTEPALLRVNCMDNTFFIENVTFDLEIGIHKLSLFGHIDKHPEEQYANYGMDMGFALYICDGETFNQFPSFVNDVKNVESHVFIKEIPAEQAFTKEYGYNNFKTNHIEKITIPRTFFYKTEGAVVIKLAVYYITDEGEYFFETFGYIFSIYLEYERINDNQIRISNLREYRRIL